MIDWMVPFLIGFPLLIALLVFFVGNHKLRAMIIYTGAAVIMAVTAALTVTFFMNGAQTVKFAVETEVIDHVILGTELFLMIFVSYLCFKYRKYWIALLSIVPTLLIAWFDLTVPKEALTHIYVDRLAVLMCLIIGFVGSMIAVYAAGYMHGYHVHHTEVQDRRNVFYALLFIFLSAMFGFVLSSDLMWIDLFWEITSVCSFLLIGYTRTEEAITNSFRALWMNLLGGTALAVGIVFGGVFCGTTNLQRMVYYGRAGIGAATITIALIAFAALTKSAQLPFSGWLLGAMVAPTPSSALLHSATMVKAGVYILFRLSPALHGNMTGDMITFVGGFTFLAASFMAIANCDGKKVLAFSTISNLGLMVACAGMGTSGTIWAGVFLMIFHAVSKSLLFQDIGAVENSIHSRNIEDMHGLLFRLPRLATFMFIGIACMFLAPFGMLISKGSTLKASIDEGNMLMTLFICFGSAATAFYWSKWMGKLLQKNNDGRYVDVTRRNELVSLYFHATVMVGLCLFYPAMSTSFVHPLVQELYGTVVDVLPLSTLVLMTVIILAVFAIPLVAYGYTKNLETERKLSYMNGINLGDNKHFVGSMGEARQANLVNFYFDKLIGPERLMRPSCVITVVVLVVMICMIVGGAVV